MWRNVYNRDEFYLLMSGCCVLRFFHSGESIVTVLLSVLGADFWGTTLVVTDTVFDKLGHVMGVFV